MANGNAQYQSIVESLRGLSPERVAEVEDFVNFLRARDAERELTRASSRLAEPAFAAVWENSDDADYDRI